MKTKLFNKQRIIGAALIFMALSLCVVFLPYLTRPVDAHASLFNIVTFEDIRTGTVGSLKRSENLQIPALPLAGTSESQRRRNFASYEFQRNDANFAHNVTGSDIAGLSDKGITLGAKSNAILNPTVPVSDRPLLTIICHGQGGRASDWSNDGKTRNLQYRQNSLIEQLRRQSGANVYVARSYIYNIKYDVTSDSAFTKGGCPSARNDVYRGPDLVGLANGLELANGLDRRNMTRPLLSLFPLEADNNSYLAVDEALRNNINYEQNRLYELRDKERHNIIIFESRDNIQYRNFVYNELNAILTMLLYDYYDDIGVVPVINMISHSTGGVWNMMWASKHPRLVHSIFAESAPFYGSTLARLTREHWASKSLNSSITKFINNPSSFDNTDELQTDILRANWADADRQSSKMRLYTMAARTCKHTVNIEIFLAYGLVDGAPAYLVDSTDYNTYTGYCCPNKNCDVVYDDMAVGRYSAWAIGLPGNITRWEKIFNGSNSDKNLSAHPDLPGDPVAHARMTQDSDVITYILSNINMTSRFTYATANNTVTITKANIKFEGGLKIPSQIGGMQVTAIGTSAFDEQTNLSEVTLPDTITSIGIAAFQQCTGLTKVEMPSNLLRIELMAFNLCTSLSEITIPDGTQFIGHRAFYGCVGLRSITIPSSVSGVGGEMFNACSNQLEITWYYNPTLNYGSVFSSYLKTVIFPSGTTSIGFCAFYYCTSLTDVYIPSSVQTIDDWAFYGCSNLKKVTIESGSQLTTLGYEVFYGCSSLEEITIPFVGRYANGSGSTHLGYLFGVTPNLFIPSSLKSVTVTGGDIANNAFYDCRDIKSITISGGVNSIGNWAFALCSSLTDVDIFAAVGIGSYAFYNCTNLTNLYMANVTSINAWAFANCGKLKDFIMPGNVTVIEHYAFYNCSSLTNISIPIKVTYIGSEAFRNCISIEEVLFEPRNTILLNIHSAAFMGCTSLTSITIIDLVNYIGEMAFADCTNLETVYIERSAIMYGGNITNLGSNAFINCYSLTSIYVPDDSIIVYKNAANWSAYQSKIMPISYTITYNLNGGSFNTPPPPVTFTIEDLPYSLPTPTRTGYDFAGWYGDSAFTGNVITQITTTGNKTFYAKWDKITYTITYNLNGGTLPPNTSVTFTVSDLPLTLPTPTRTGYDFAGWYTDSAFTGNAVTQITTINNKTFYAKWVNYAITYNLNGGTLPPNTPVTFATADLPLTLPIPTRTGYDFAGWYDNSAFTGNAVTKITTINNKTFYAKWVNYTITYNLNGGTLPPNAPVTFATADLPLTLPTPTRTGYDFAGWYDNSAFTGNAVTQITTIGNKTFYAKWVNYAITYNLNGGTLPPNAPVTFATADLPLTLPISTRTGYDFAGWFTNPAFTGNAVTQITTIENKAFYAKWVNYTITYNLNGGTLPSNAPVTFATADLPLTLPTPTRTGYDFAGWYGDSAFTGNAVTQITTINNKEYWAKWTIKTYTVTFKDYDGTVLKTQAGVEYGSAAPAPSSPDNKTGWHFTGWDVNFSAVKSNLTVTALYAINMYTVSYNSNKPAGASGGGTTANSSHTYDTAKVLTANGFSWSGWIFAGWNKKADGSGTAYTNSQSVINLTDTDGETVTLYAQWTPITYGITYNLNGGALPPNAPVTFTTADLPFVLPIPTHSDYAFGGWFDNSGFNGGAIGQITTIGPKTYWAKWNNFAITYNLDGGTQELGAPTEFTPANLPVTLPIPTKNGYIFSGWFDSPSLNGTAIEQITTKGNKEYWAKWTQPVKETILFDYYTGSINRNPLLAARQYAEYTVTFAESGSKHISFEGTDAYWWTYLSAYLEIRDTNGVLIGQKYCGYADVILFEAAANTAYVFKLGFNAPTAGNMTFKIWTAEPELFIEMSDCYTEATLWCPGNNAQTEFYFYMETQYYGNGMIQLIGSGDIEAEVYEYDEIYDVWNLIGTVNGGWYIYIDNSASYKMIIHNSGQDEMIKVVFLTGYGASYWTEYYNSINNLGYQGCDRPGLNTLLFYAGTGGTYQLEIEDYGYGSLNVYICAAEVYGETIQAVSSGYMGTSLYDLELTEGWYFITFYGVYGDWNLNLV